MLLRDAIRPLRGVLQTENAGRWTQVLSHWTRGVTTSSPRCHCFSVWGARTLVWDVRTKLRLAAWETGPSASWQTPVHLSSTLTLRLSAQGPGGGAGDPRGIVLKYQPPHWLHYCLPSPLSIDLICPDGDPFVHAQTTTPPLQMRRPRPRVDR